MSERLRGLIAAGNAAIAEGDLARARESLEAAATIAPADAGIHRALAQIDLAEGEIERARARLDRAAFLQPSDRSVARLRLGAALKAGDLAGASRASRALIGGRLGRFGQWLGEAPRRLAWLLAAAGDRGAMPGLTAAYAARRAAALEARADFDAARAVLAPHLTRHPEHPELLIRYGIAALRGGDPATAVAHLRKARACAPDSARAEAALTLGLAATVETGAAAERALALPEAAFAEPLGHEARAAALTAVGRIAEARAGLETAVERFPEHAGLQRRLGVALNTLGETEAAMACFERALVLQPDFGRLYYALAVAGRLAPDSPAFQAAARLGSDPQTPQRQRAFARFATGRVRMRAGEHAAGFADIVAANRLTPAVYDAQETEAMIDGLISHFDAGYFAEAWSAGERGRGRVFVVGLPRSGSTLVEQILGSHPQVLGAGEREAVAEQVLALHERLAPEGGYPDGIRSLDAAAFAEFGERYLAAVPGEPTDCPVVVDKQLLNFLYLGLIARMLPAARIVHCRRDPMDQAFSIYCHHFDGAYGYSFDQANIVHYFRQYERLMAHWHAVLPIPIHDIAYEDLVSDQEATTRALLDALDLDFDPACLAFHRSDRPVTTLSATQVRREIYADALAAWTPYEAELGPLKRAFRSG